MDEITLLTAVEEGRTFDTCIEFLRNGHQGELPAAVHEWLLQLRRNHDAFTKIEWAQLIRVEQAELMALASQDRTLTKICQLVDEQTILVRSSHLSRFRRRMKVLGYLVE